MNTAVIGLVMLLALPAPAVGLTLVRTLESPTGQVAGFGYSVVPVAGHTAVLVGAPVEPLADDVPGGAAFVLGADPEARIDNPTPEGLDLFGFSAAQVGTNILVGAPGDDAIAADSGLVHVVDAATMALSGTLPNPSGLVEAGFGWTLTPLGDDVLVGCYRCGTVYRIDVASGAVVSTYSPPPSRAEPASGQRWSPMGRGWS